MGLWCDVSVSRVGSVLRGLGDWGKVRATSGTGGLRGRDETRVESPLRSRLRLEPGKGLGYFSSRDPLRWVDW